MRGQRSCLTWVLGMSFLNCGKALTCMVEILKLPSKVATSKLIWVVAVLIWGVVWLTWFRLCGVCCCHEWRYCWFEGWHAVCWNGGGKSWSNENQEAKQFHGRHVSTGWSQGQCFSQARANVLIEELVYHFVLREEPDVPTWQVTRELLMQLSVVIWFWFLRLRGGNTAQYWKWQKLLRATFWATGVWEMVLLPVWGWKR